jgi:hypothetical protein
MSSTSPQLAEAPRTGNDLPAAGLLASSRSVRCVASGYLADGCSCGSTVPAQVLHSAWASEQDSGVLGDGFFRFDFNGEVWLSYGLQDGRVRGVYCPEHATQRDRRAALSGSRSCAQAREWVLAA